MIISIKYVNFVNFNGSKGLDLAIHKMVAYGDLMVDDTQLDTPILYQGELTCSC